MAGVSEELIFLERLFLQVGTVDTDSQLEACLKTLLPQAISRLNNPSEQVRNKVVELLTHINKRLKSRNQVQIPLETLLQFYLDSSSSAYIVNFTVIYIKLGFPRASSEKKAELLPLLIQAAELRPPHRESLVYLIIGSLDTVKLPSGNSDATKFLCLDKHPKVSGLILSTIQNIILFPYWFKIEEPEYPSELSKFTCQELINNIPFISKGDSLEQLKISCLKLLCCGVYTDKQIFPHLILASADPRSSVFNFADGHIRKIQGAVNLDEKDLLGQLYNVYMGTQAKELPGGHQVSLDRRRGPASVRLRLKLLPYMSKSKLIIWPTAIQVLFDSLYGEITNSKLRYLALTFCHNMLKNMTDVQLQQAGQVLLKSGLLQLLTFERAEPTLLRQVFPCIGLLVSKCSTLATPALLQNLFTALINERDRDVGQSLRDCLVMMSSVYMCEDSWLEELIMQGLSSRSSLARLTALHYLACCLPKPSVNRIYLLLQASNHQDEEVCIEAKKALYSGTCNTSSSRTDLSEKLNVDSIPDFAQLLTVVLDKQSKNKSNDSRLHCEMLRYLRLCLAKVSGVTDLSLECISHPCSSTPLISRYLKTLESGNTGLIERYTNFILSVIKIDIRLEALGSLIEILGCYPELVTPLVQPYLDKFMTELGHSKEVIRSSCSQIVGLLSSPNIETVHQLMELSDQSSDIEKKHGYLLASCYLYERVASMSNVQPLKQSLILNCVDGLNKDSNIVVSGWCFWLRIVGRTGPLPLSESDKKKIVDALFDIVFSTKHVSKTKEHGCSALGMLCVGEDNFPHRSFIIQHFTDKTNEIKDIELVLSIGESLVNCVLGPLSDNGCDPWTRERRVTQYSGNDTAKMLIDLLLPLVNNTHPNTRQCCSFWLLSMAKHCSHLEAVKCKLEDLQEAFMELLSDSSSLVQEASSKGLALVYESGSGSLDRTKLVSKLVEQLTSGKRSVSQVNQNTKLFEEGQLGKTPTGGNLSTYKELCSLASDLNQPDLIYKFMNIANHNALWNSKKGAAFGVGTLADLAAGEMDQHLPKILPKLYRYQYDPTASIQQTMTSIWQALTSNIPNVLEKYGDEIYADLVPSLTSGQYRVRQSSCKALSDFIRSPPSHDIMMKRKVSLLSEVWIQLLRVMDDVHDQTRQAATSTTKTLSRMMVHVCEKSTEHRSTVGSVVLPILLEKGVTSNVSEVRNVSAEALCSLIKVGVGEDEVVRLVPALLLASQHLDYNNLSHLSTMVSGSEAAQEVVDSVRASAIKSHFTVQTLSRCVEYVKEPMLAELTPNLVDFLKSSVGLGTRLATCHFLTLLCHSVPSHQIQPFIGKYLGGLLSGLSDRNGAIRRQYASTIGQLCKYAKESSLDRLIEKLKSLYFDKNDEGVRQAVGYTLQAMLTHNQDAIKSRSSILLPMAFYAKHLNKLKDGSNDKYISLWEEVNDDLGGGSGVSTHSSQISILLSDMLSSSEWQAKAQAGRSIKTLVNKAGDSLSENDVTLLTNTLVENLFGRSWDGKEELLHALSSLAKYQKSLDGWLEVLERECTRGSLKYKRDSVKAFSEALTHLNNRNIIHNKYTSLLDINNKIISSVEKSKEDKDADEEMDGASKDIKNDVIQTCLEALGKAFPSDLDTQENVINQVIGLVDRLECSTRPVQVTIMSTVVTSIERLHPALLSPQHLEQCLKTLTYALGIAKHTALRKEALNLILILIQRLDASSVFMKRLEQVFMSFKEDLDEDTSSEVRTRLSDVKNAFQL